jgi:hypothetical protein
MFNRFTNICSEILLHISGYSFCAESHILAQFCQMLLAHRASKIICAKADLLCTKNVGAIHPTGPLI